jgi:hypothetical protein
VVLDAVQTGSVADPGDGVLDSCRVRHDDEVLPGSIEAGRLASSAASEGSSIGSGHAEVIGRTRRSRDQPAAAQPGGRAALEGLVSGDERAWERRVGSYVGESSRSAPEVHRPQVPGAGGGRGQRPQLRALAADGRGCSSGRPRRRVRSPPAPQSGSNVAATDKLLRTPRSKSASQIVGLRSWALRVSNPRPSPSKGGTNLQVRRASRQDRVSLRTAENR